MKKTQFIFLIISIAKLLTASSAVAQYESIRFPQTQEEIALFQKNKVMGETQWSLENDKKLPYFTRAFDRQGRTVISADYYHSKYYLYDAKGYVVSFLDSAKTDKGFDVSEYKFQYDDNGILKEMTGPNMKSTFRYDANKKNLFERLTKGDTVLTNI